jgi:endonuclease G
MQQRDLAKIAVGAVLLIRRYPKTILPLLLSGVVLFYLYESMIARPNASYMGTPKATHFSLDTFHRIFRNSHFMIGYSDYRGNPLWVSYLLTPIPQNAKRYKRPSSFYKDWRNITQIKHGDYTRSGYDRGHMAPNYAISRLYGREAQIETFDMTNITPQKPNLNRKLWQRLEEIEASEFPKHFDKVWVFTGPIFDKEKTHLSSSNFVEIPDAFFKIYIGLKGDNPPQSLAFMMPQNVKGNESLMEFVTTIDAIEQATHLDFFHKLDDALEKKIERATDPKAWYLESVAKRPSRY